MRTFKRSLALVLAIAMVLTTFGMTVVSAAQYNDTAGHWAESYINTWSDHGVIQGDGGYFRPDDAITRAEVAQVTDNVISYEKIADNMFTDVSTTDWFADAVLKLAAAGTLTGNGDGTMTPNNYMTREEAMTMLARAYGLTVENSQAGITQYADYQNISDYATGYVGAMTAAGYVGGYEDGTIRPKDYISRAEFVKIIDNMIKLYITEPGSYGPEYVGGIIMVKTGGVTLNGIVAGGVVVSPQVSGDVTITGSQISGDIVNLSEKANVTSNTGTVTNPSATTKPNNIVIGGGGSGGGSGSGSATVTVKFYYGENYGTVKTKSVTKGRKMSESAVPTPSESNWDGLWYTSKSAAEKCSGTTFDPTTTAVNKNYDLYAGHINNYDLKDIQIAVDNKTDYVNVYVGDVLTATNLTPAAAKNYVSYQWYRAKGINETGDKISGATKSTYTAAEADKGMYLKVVVTGDGTNYNGTVSDVSTIVLAKDAPSIYPEKTTTSFGNDAATTVTLKEGQTVKGVKTENGEMIPADQYTFDAETGKLTISKEYLAGLTDGQNVFTIVVSDDDAYNVTFVVTTTGGPTQGPVPTEEPEPTATPVTPGVPTATPVNPDVPTATPVNPDAPTATPVNPDMPTATPVNPDVPTATPAPPANKYVATVNVTGGTAVLKDANGNAYPTVGVSDPTDAPATEAPATEAPATEKPGDPTTPPVSGTYTWAASAELTAETNIIENSDIVISNDIAAGYSVDAKTFGGTEYTGGINLRRTKEYPIAGDSSKTACVIKVEVTTAGTLTAVYRRQEDSANTGKYTSGEGKDIRLSSDSASEALVEGTNFAVGDPISDGKGNDDAYRVASKDYNLQPGTYYLFGNGTTLRLYGLKYSIAGANTAAANETVQYIIPEGDVVTVDATPDTAGLYPVVEVKSADGQSVAVNDNKFTMPGQNVTAEVTFADAPATPEPSATATVTPPEPTATATNVPEPTATATTAPDPDPTATATAVPDPTVTPAPPADKYVATVNVTGGTAVLKDANGNAYPVVEPVQSSAPATEAPATEAPATEAPATEAPATGAPPQTEKPTMSPNTEITESYVFIADNFNSAGTVAIEADTKLDGGKVYSPKGNKAANNKGKSEINGTEYYNSMRLKGSQNSLSFKAGMDAVVTVYGEAHASRVLAAGTTNGGVELGKGVLASGLLTFNVSAGTTVYLTAVNDADNTAGDVFIAGFTVEPTASVAADDNSVQYIIPEGDVVTVDATSDTAGLYPVVTVKGADGQDIAVNENKFTMPGQNVTADVTFAEAPATPEPTASTTPVPPTATPLFPSYSDWKQGQAKADGTDGAAKEVVWPAEGGKPAINVTSRNIYTALDEAVSAGQANVSVDVYLDPAVPKNFRIYLESGDQNYQNPDGEYVFAEVANNINSKVNYGPEPAGANELFDYSQMTAGWYRFNILVDYEGTNLITLTVTAPDGTEAGAAAMSGIAGKATALKQVRLIQTAAAAQFADMSIAVSGQPTATPAPATASPTAAPISSIVIPANDLILGGGATLSENAGQTYTWNTENEKVTEDMKEAFGDPVPAAYTEKFVVMGADGRNVSKTINIPADGEYKLMVMSIEYNNRYFTASVDGGTAINPEDATPGKALKGTSNDLAITQYDLGTLTSGEHTVTVTSAVNNARNIAAIAIVPVSVAPVPSATPTAEPTKYIAEVNTTGGTAVLKDANGNVYPTYVPEASEAPTAAPTEAPTAEPSDVPSATPVVEPTETASAAPVTPVTYKYTSTTEIKGGNLSEGDTSTFVDEASDEIKTLFADASDPAKVDPALTANYRNYVGGTGNNASQPYIEGINLEPGTYNVYYLGYNNEVAIDATIGDISFSIPAASGVPVSRLDKNTSRLLKAYKLTFTTETALTNATLMFNTTDEYLPDIFSVILTNTTVSASTAAADGAVKYLIPEGDVVTVDATPETAGQIANVAVTGADGRSITVENSKFTMPGQNVRADVTFADAPPTETPVSTEAPTPAVKPVEVMIADEMTLNSGATVYKDAPKEPTAAYTEEYSNIFGEDFSKAGTSKVGFLGSNFGGYVTKNYTIDETGAYKAYILVSYAQSNNQFSLSKEGTEVVQGTLVDKSEKVGTNGQDLYIYTYDIDNLEAGTYEFKYYSELGQCSDFVAAAIVPVNSDAPATESPAPATETPAPTTAPQTYTYMPENKDIAMTDNQMLIDNDDVKVSITNAVTTTATTDAAFDKTNYPYSLPFRGLAVVSAHMDDLTANNDTQARGTNVAIKPEKSGDLTAYVAINGSKTMRIWDNTDNVEVIVVTPASKAVNTISARLIKGHEYLLYTSGTSASIVKLEYKTTNDPDPTAPPATEAPTAAPTEAPTAEPSEAPTAEPSEAPTAMPIDDYIKANIASVNEKLTVEVSGNKVQYAELVPDYENDKVAVDILDGTVGNMNVVGSIDTAIGLVNKYDPVAKYAIHYVGSAYATVAAANEAAANYETEGNRPEGYKNYNPVTVFGKDDSPSAIQIGQAVSASLGLTTEQYNNIKTSDLATFLGYLAANAKDSVNVTAYGLDGNSIFTYKFTFVDKQPAPSEAPTANPTEAPTAEPSEAPTTAPVSVVLFESKDITPGTYNITNSYPDSEIYKNDEFNFTIDAQCATAASNGGIVVGDDGSIRITDISAGSNKLVMYNKNIKLPTTSDGTRLLEITADFEFSELNDLLYVYKSSLFHMENPLYYKSGGNPYIAFKQNADSPDKDIAVYSIPYMGEIVVSQEEIPKLQANHTYTVKMLYDYKSSSMEYSLYDGADKVAGIIAEHAWDIDLYMPIEKNTITLLETTATSNGNVDATLKNMRAVLTYRPKIAPTPTAEPTAAPTAEPTEAPTAEPTTEPTEAPTAEPTTEPTEAPTAEPTEAPTTEPTLAPVTVVTAETGMDKSHGGKTAGVTFKDITADYTDGDYAAIFGDNLSKAGTEKMGFLGGSSGNYTTFNYEITDGGLYKAYMLVYNPNNGNSMSITKSGDSTPVVDSRLIDISPKLAGIDNYDVKALTYTTALEAGTYEIKYYRTDNSFCSDPIAFAMAPVSSPAAYAANIDLTPIQGAGVRLVDSLGEVYQSDITEGSIVKVIANNVANYDVSLSVTAGGVEIPLSASNEFVMPSQPVKVKATYNAIRKVTITVPSEGTPPTLSYGTTTATLSIGTAHDFYFAEGTKATLSVTPPTDKVAQFTATGTTIDAATGEFTVGGEDIAISFEYIQPTKYAVNLNNTTNGTVTTNKTEAAEGETVTLTVTPDSGYVTQNVYVNENGGTNSDEIITTSINEFTFTMPAYAVDIAAVFAQVTGYVEYLFDNTHNTKINSTTAPTVTYAGGTHPTPVFTLTNTSKSYSAAAALDITSNLPLSGTKIAWNKRASKGSNGAGYFINLGLTDEYFAGQNCQIYTMLSPNTTTDTSIASLEGTVANKFGKITAAAGMAEGVFRGIDAADAQTDGTIKLIYGNKQALVYYIAIAYYTPVVQ